MRFESPFAAPQSCGTVQVQPAQTGEPTEPSPSPLPGIPEVPGGPAVAGGAALLLLILAYFLLAQ